jgi:hypothetical protein
MEWWQPIALGAGIAILAGPLTELFRSYFTRKHEQDERRRTFQRDRLLSLLEHLAAMQSAAGGYFVVSKRSGVWTPEPNSEYLAALNEAFPLAFSDWVVLDDHDVREWSARAARAALGLPAAESIEGAQALFDEFMELHIRLTIRIGELVRSL